MLVIHCPFPTIGSRLPAACISLNFQRLTSWKHASTLSPTTQRTLTTAATVHSETVLLFGATDAIAAARRGFASWFIKRSAEVSPRPTEAGAVDSALAGGKSETGSRVVSATESGIQRVAGPSVANTKRNRSHVKNSCNRLQCRGKHCPSEWHDTAIDCSFNNSRYSCPSPLAVTARGLLPAPTTSVYCTRRGDCCSEAWLPLLLKILRRTISTAAHLPLTTSAGQEHGDRVSRSIGLEASHAAFPIITTDCDASCESQRLKLETFCRCSACCSGSSTAPAIPGAADINASTAILAGVPHCRDISCCSWCAIFGTAASGVAVTAVALWNCCNFWRVGDVCPQIGVLLLRKASDSECFVKRSRRRVPLLFSNEVHSITFPESSDISLASASSANTGGATKEFVCSNTQTSSRCIDDTIGITCSRVTESATASVTSSHVPITARALRDRGEKISGLDKGRNLGMDNVAGCLGGSLDMKDSSRSNGGSHKIKGDSCKERLQKRRSRPLRNGLVYIEDDEGTRYGIGYCCPRHPLIASRVLTAESNEKIDVDFFFRRMQSALLQRQALREAFDWLGSRGTSLISVSNSMSNTGGYTNSCSRSDTTSFFSSSRLVRDGRTSVLESARTSNERDGSKGAKPPKGTLLEAQLSDMAEGITTGVNAEEGVANPETTMSTSALQTAIQEKQSSKDYFRLINSEGDLLPGVVIDIYGKYASIQLLTCGLDFLLSRMVEALQRLLQPRGFVVRLDHPDRLLEHSQQHAEEKKRQPVQQSQQGLESPLFQGEVRHRHESEKHFGRQRHGRAGHVPDSVIIEENGCLFPVDLLRGEGTGWLYDRRELRHRLAFLSTGKRVLDLFCNSGGALCFCDIPMAADISQIPAGSVITSMRLGGACACVGLCSDERALQLGLQASRLNGLQCNTGRNTSSGTEIYSIKGSIKAGSVTLVLANVFDWLAAATEETYPELFDVVVLDPPNWAWRSSDLQQQRQKQQELIARAARLIAERGFLVVTCSSRHYCAAGAQFFADVQAASASVGKTATLCGEGSSGLDFPTDVSLPRSRELLWGLIQLESR